MREHKFHKMWKASVVVVVVIVGWWRWCRVAIVIIAAATGFNVIYCAKNNIFEIISVRTPEQKKNPHLPTNICTGNQFEHAF